MVKILFLPAGPTKKLGSLWLINFNPFVTFVPDRLQKTQKKLCGKITYIRSAQVKEKLLIAIDRLQFLLHKYIYI